MKHLNFCKLFLMAVLLFGFTSSTFADTSNSSPVSGSDTTSGAMQALTVSDITNISTSNDVRVVSDGNWPMAGAYDESKYLEFIFQPNLPVDAIIDAVSVAHEYRRSAALNGAKLEIWDGTTWSNQTLNIPATTNTDLSQSLDLLSGLNTAGKINNLKVRFLAFKNAVVATNTTSHDFLNLTVTYHLPPVIQHTLTYSAGLNGTLTGNLNQTVNSGENSTAVTAVADSGFHFVDWNDASTDNPRTDLNVISDLSVIANFAVDVALPGSYTISTSAGTGGAISPSGMINVTENNSQAFTVTPDANYHIVGVFVDGVSVGAVTNYTFSTVTANHTISATFALDTHMLNITAVNGLVARDPDQVSYDYGSVVELTAIADAGYTFSGWSGDLSGSVNPTSVTLDSEKSVTANFLANSVLPMTHTITASAGAGGTVDPSGAVSVADGSSQIFTFTPDSGFEVSEISIDSATTTATSTYTFANVTSDHAVSVLFTEVATSTATTTSPAENPAPSAGGSNSPSGGSGGGPSLLPANSAPTLSPADQARLLALLESFKQGQNPSPAGRVLGVSTVATETNAAANLTAPTSSVATTTPAGGNLFGKFGRWIANLFWRLF